MMGTHSHKCDRPFPWRKSIFSSPLPHTMSCSWKKNGMIEHVLLAKLFFYVNPHALLFGVLRIKSKGLSFPLAACLIARVDNMLASTCRAVVDPSQTFFGQSKTIHLPDGQRTIGNAPERPIPKAQNTQTLDCSTHHIVSTWHRWIILYYTTFAI